MKERLECPFCGYRFRCEEALRSCRSCPRQKRCGGFKCPRCGYEIPPEPGIIKVLRDWGAKLNAGGS